MSTPDPNRVLIFDTTLRDGEQSPGEATGNPASMTSTPSSARARASRSFSGCVMLQPGDCSPSRSVVSKIRTRFGSRLAMVVTVVDW